MGWDLLLLGWLRTAGTKPSHLFHARQRATSLWRWWEWRMTGEGNREANVASQSQKQRIEHLLVMYTLLKAQGLGRAAGFAGGNSSMLDKMPVA